MTDAEAPVPALKERAGVVNALIDGVQTVLIRTPRLQPSDYDGQFALYPAYSHQDPERYSPRAEHYYHTSKVKPEEGIPLRAVATVDAEYRIDRSDLPALEPHYVYSAPGLRDKYDFEDDGTRLLVLRVERLDAPQLIEERSEYRGCRTWIQLDESIDPGPSTHVLDDATFAERTAAIRASL